MRFAFYGYVEQWPDIIEQISRAEPHLRSIGRPLAADMLLHAYGQLRDDLTRLGTESAIAGTTTLRSIEKRTRVRPDTGGGGGLRLQDSLTVEHISHGGLMPGSIGVANLDLLDSRVPWWITNELGSSARVGGRLFGYFYQPGQAEPNPSDFRQHALFETGGSPISGLGIIKRPIPARRFIEESVKLIDREWKTAFEAIRARFESRLIDVGRTYR